MISDQTRDVGMAVEFSNSKKHLHLPKNRQDMQTKDNHPCYNQNKLFQHVMDTTIVTQQQKNLIDVKEAQEVLSLPNYLQTMQSNTQCLHFLNAQMKQSGQINHSNQQIEYVQNQKLKDLQHVSNLLNNLSSACAEIGNRQ
eukprot:TRINITY_DN4036_c2_g1_i2.p1 TRINITY_DN4036_c2_g1~~TRINITY_DN4036_c2_g1_i2.p1  ORF type:complete len:141 (-),score=6.11 TRINITY_DN4036_c2_g1_i2:1021-1443(-)